MKVLVINCGSSSAKFELIDMTNEQSLAKGNCERIGIANPIFSYKNLLTGEKIDKMEVPMENHTVAVELILKTLQDEKIGVISTVDEIDSIGHRIVHGGEYYEKSVIVDDEVIKNLEEIAPLAHIMGIKVIQKLLPGKKNVVVFDTAFHQTMPAKAYMYPYPYEDYTDLKVRKYGFHGTSHRYVSEVAREMLGKEDSKIIVCHLGNGASISAVQNGKVVDTSMGMTPLAGVMMGTRTGDVDPASVIYIMRKRGLSLDEMNNRMNKQSGILGMIGTSSDFRDLDTAKKAGDEKAILAYDMFCYRIQLYIGAYIAAMNGIDAIAFTGGIGENSVGAKQHICEALSYFGIEIDKEKNAQRLPGNVELSTKNSKVKIYKIETAEELVIARDTYKLTKE